MRVYLESQCGYREGSSTIDLLFSLRQLQAKCKEHRRPRGVDPTNTFDLVCIKGLFTLIETIGCLIMITLFQERMHGTKHYDASSSNAFPISNGVKQDCIPENWFEVFFSELLSYAFGSSSEGVCLQLMMIDDKLFSLASFRAKTKPRQILIRDILFADDAALISPTEIGSP